MQLMGVLRERAFISPKTCTVKCRNVTYVHIKHTADNGQCPIQYRYRKRRDQVLYAWYLVSFSQKPYDARTQNLCFTFPYRIIPNTLQCNKIYGELRSSYGRHVRRNRCTFSLNCPLKPPGFSENFNVSTYFSTAPNTKFHEYSFSSLEVLHADGGIKI